MTRIALATLIVLSLMTTPGPMRGAAPAPGPLPGDACEPSDLLDVRAAVVSMQAAGDGFRAVVEVTVAAHLSLRDARVEGWELGDDGARRSRRVDEPLGPVARDSLRTRRYVLDLEGGVEHHLLFQIEGEGFSGEPHGSTTYVRINTDTALEPERRPGLLQFRGRPETGSEP